MKITIKKKLIVKIYESFCAEHYCADRQRNARGKELTRRAPPPLHAFVEDQLLLQYGMPSMARKTLLQMVATAVRTQPTCSSSSLALCSGT